MQRLHDRLMRSSRWYNRWHQEPHANLLTWALFAAFSVSYALVTVIAISNASIEFESDSQLGAVSRAFARSLKTVETPAEARFKELTNASIQVSEGHHRGPTDRSLEVLRSSLTERREAFIELALTNPLEIRRYVFDVKALQSIPEAARNLIEQPIEKEGRFQMYIATEAFTEDGELSYEEYALEVSPTERYQLALTEEEAYALSSGSNLRVRGVAFDSIIIPSGIDEVGRASASPAVLGASTLKRIAVVPINFLNDTSRPRTREEIHARTFTNANSLTALLREGSYSQWQFEGDAFDWITVNHDNSTSCRPADWVMDVETKLSAQGVSLSSFDYRIYLLSSAPACGWTGLGELPGNDVWILDESSRASTYPYEGLAAHELGHNFGFHHAGDSTCTSASSAYTCAGYGYGDTTDPMGRANPLQYGAVNKVKHWIPGPQVLTIGSSGTYTLEPLGSVSSGYKMIRIYRPYYKVPNGYYHLEYRTTTGFDQGLPSKYQNKVLVRLADGDYSLIQRTTLLDSVLGEGNTLIDDEADIRIQVVSTTANGATLAIDMSTSTTNPAPCLRQNPTITIAPNVMWGAPGEQLTYTAQVRNNDSASCVNATFAVVPMLPPGFVHTPSSLAATLTPGQEAMLTFTVTSPANAVSGTYTFTEVVQNNDVPTSMASASANYNIIVTDSTSPTVTVTSPINGTTLKSTKVTVAASAGDPSGIATIELRIDGVLVKTCTGVTQCTYAWDIRKVTKGTHTITATAYDASASRNRGEKSITVTK